MPIEKHLILDVKYIREHKFNMNRNEFAATFGFALKDIKEWEEGRYQPIYADRTLLILLDRAPEMILNLLENGTLKSKYVTA
jgi:DNA-binding transcriptional regulator YiaG